MARSSNSPKVTPDRRGFWGGVISTMEIQPYTPSFRRGAVHLRTREENEAQIRRTREAVQELLHVVIEQTKRGQIA